MNLWVMDRVQPAGSLYTTSSDYAKFLHACATDAYIREEMFKPAVPTLQGKDRKAIEEKGASPDDFRSIAWGTGIGIQTNTEGKPEVVFHWGDNGTGYNFAAYNLNSDKGIVLLTNDRKGPLAFRTTAELVVGDLSATSQWLSIREDLPMHKWANVVQEKKPSSTLGDTAQNIEQRTLKID